MGSCVDTGAGSQRLHDQSRAAFHSRGSTLELVDVFQRGRAYCRAENA